MWPFTTKKDENQEPETTYGTEKIEEKSEYDIVKVKVRKGRDRTIMKEGYAKGLRYRRAGLRVSEIEVGDIKYNDVRGPRWPINHNTVYSIKEDRITDVEVVNRRTLVIEAEAELNYKEEDGERTYTSVKSEDVNRYFKEEQDLDNS